MKSFLIVNFGGPRGLNEVEPFLRALLTDRDVVRTRLPTLLHNYLFSRVAKKRALKISSDYASIGGKSPIFDDTEAIAAALREKLDAEVLTFHRYIPATHREALAAIERCPADEIVVFPMFPQFTYATTGSIARFFSNHLSKKALSKLQWVKSYPNHPAYIALTQKRIRAFLAERKLEDEETILLFSAHGLPQQFVDEGDLYEVETEKSFASVMRAFPSVLGRLSYQSKFGPGEWLRPYTSEICEEILMWHDGRKNLVFVPISFTSDHIETLFEIEQEYLPPVKKAGLSALRLPAFNRSPDWIQTIITILEDFNPLRTSMLVRS